jgi:hypothetical protein
MRQGRPADGFIGQIWSSYVVAKYLSFTLMPSTYTNFNICMYRYCRSLISKFTPHLSRALPGSKLFLRFCFPLGGIHFALGGVLFSPFVWPFRWALYGLLGSVAKGPTFFLQNIKSAEKIVECKIDLMGVNFTFGCTFWLIWQNTFQISWQHWLGHFAPRQVPPQCHKYVRF